MAGEKNSKKSSLNLQRFFKKNNWPENGNIFDGGPGIYMGPRFHKAHRIGESLFTFFASLGYVPMFLLELQNRLF